MTKLRAAPAAVPIPAVPAALVVGGGGAGCAALEAALLATGCTVTCVSPAELAGAPVRPDRPTVVFVSAAVGLGRVTTVARLFEVAGTRPPVIVFPEGDGTAAETTALEECVDGGYDFLVPPFLPSLVRGRMSTSTVREDLGCQVAELEAMATLRECEGDLEIAREIQAGFLPAALPTADGWEVGSRFRPARRVAGDFYDGFRLVNGLRMAFVVADVCDKGVGAALFMALIRTLLRHTAEHTGISESPGVELFETVAADARALVSVAVSPMSMMSLGAGPLLQAVVGTNRYMARNHLEQGYFATLFFAVLDPASGMLVYINGGHNPPLVVHRDGRLEQLEPTGPAIGMMDDSVFALAVCRLEPGDLLFAYTDGVTEARSPSGELFGTERMIRAVCETRASAESVLNGVEEAMRAFVGAAEQSDDITMLAVRRATL